MWLDGGRQMMDKDPIYPKTKMETYLEDLFKLAKIWRDE